MAGQYNTLGKALLNSHQYLGLKELITRNFKENGQAKGVPFGAHSYAYKSVGLPGKALKVGFFNKFLEF